MTDVRIINSSNSGITVMVGAVATAIIGWEIVTGVLIICGILSIMFID